MQNAQETAINPRGTRPVEHGTRSEKCASAQEWPFCTTDEWVRLSRQELPSARRSASCPITNCLCALLLHQGPKCPSGCRIQGLMNKYDHDLLRKVEKIRGILDQNEQKHRSTDHLTKQTYDYAKERLLVDSGQTAFKNLLKESRFQRWRHKQEVNSGMMSLSLPSLRSQQQLLWPGTATASENHRHEDQDWQTAERPRCTEGSSQGPGCGYAETGGTYFNAEGGLLCHQSWVAETKKRKREKCLDMWLQMWIH